ncbi:DUF2059 domain-containing protein [Brevundimonas sp. TWP1-2-1b1]|uniref:DUF2059 domain-containing protein n=1 Tax=unclassified Brevundimonas TaxID=2622653 RepID=UPI003CF36CE7
MKQLIGGLCMALTLLAAPVAMAETTDVSAEKLALANKFIALIQGEQMGAALGQMTAMMMPQSDTMSAEQAAEFREVMSEATASMLPRMFEAVAPIYADIFTLEELEALVDFYQSDVGRSMMSKSYEAAPRIATAIQGVMPELMADLGDQLCNRFECTPEQRREVKAAMARASRGQAAQ